MKIKSKYLSALLLIAGLFAGSIVLAKIIFPGLPEQKVALKPTATVPPKVKSISTIPPETKPIATLPPETAPATTAPPEPSPTTAPTTPPVFISPPALTINGIVYDKHTSYAIVNNRIVKEGEIVEGATLIKIERDKARFLFQNKEFEARIK